MLITLISAIIFVLLAGFNVWSMLATPTPLARNPQLLIRVHRIAGYIFAAIFVVVSYLMLLRIKGIPDELPPRILAHMCLALMVGPLLIAKIMVARRQKASRGLLSALGISLFVVSFVLVALNISSHVLSKADNAKVPTPISAVFIIVSVAGLAGLLLFPHRVRKLDSYDQGPELPKEPPASDPHTTTLKLVRIQPQTVDAKTLRFLVQPGKRFSARPGQFLTFDWTIAGKQICRSYSICSSPMQSAYIEITSKKVANGCVSHFLNENAVVGLEVTAHGPFGQFCFDERKHKRIVLLAGGSGITPMMAILRYIDDLCVPTDATLIYSVRSQKDVLFAAEIEGLQERLQSLRYVLVLSQPEPGWNGPRGRLSEELLTDTIEGREDAFFFLCGPAPFMEHAQVLLEAMGVPPAQILRESFGTPPATISSSGVISNQVEFVRSGLVISVAHEKTLLDAAEAKGLPIPYGCRQGFCGTCATRLLSGNVRMERHDGLPEDLAAKGFILPCVSYAMGDLKLDI